MTAQLTMEYGDIRLPDRFWAKVRVDPNSGCWEWTASTIRGYGRFRVESAIRLAHRVSWTSVNGSVPNGLELDHLCRVRSCVNPSHLRVVTPRQNQTAPGSLHQGMRKVCKSGHEYTPSNTYSNRDGSRTCRTCHQMWDRVYRAKKVASLHERAREVLAKAGRVGFEVVR